MRKYKIQKGDSWWKIANANGMTVEELQNLNPGIKMHPGQVLQLKKSTQKPTQQSSQQPTTSEKPGFFTIMGNKVSSWWNGTGNSNKPAINIDAEIEAILKLPKAQREEVQREIMRKLGPENLGEWGADGNFGNTSKAAYRKFREEGHAYDFSKKSEEKPQLVSKSKKPTFDEWLYITGANYPVSNMYDMAETAFSGAFGLNTTPGEGATRQILAQMLKPVKVPVRDKNGKVIGYRDGIHYDASKRYLGKSAQTIGTLLRSIDWENVKNLPKMASNFTVGVNLENNSAIEDASGWVQTPDGGYYLGDPTDFHMLTVKNPDQNSDKPFINIGQDDPRYEEYKQSTSLWSDIRNGLWRNPAALIENLGTRQGWEGGSRELTITPEQIEAYRQEYEATINDPKKLEEYFQLKNRLTSA